MTRRLAGGAALLAILAAWPAAADTTMVRGKVVDEQGQPLADVKVEFDFQGDRPQKFARTTDKKGFYLRAGLRVGDYGLTFTKEGYQPRGIRIHISPGGLTEIPDLELKVVRVAVAPPPAAPSAPSAPAAPTPPPLEEMKAAFAKAAEATRSGRLDEAEAVYKDVLLKVPTLPAPHYFLGHVYRQKKDWAAAEAAFRKVIELEPANVDNHRSLAAVYEESGRLDKALEVLTAAAPSFESDASFQFSLGIANINAGKPAEAAAALDKAQALEPANPEPHFYLGTLAVGRNEVPAAIAHLETYVSLSGQKPQNLATAQSLLKALKARKP